MQFRVRKDIGRRVPVQRSQAEQDADDRIFISTLRDIAAGEELTYEYNLYDSDDEHERCFCAAPNCRATMFSPEEIRRRKRAAKKVLDRTARRECDKHERD